MAGRIRCLHSANFYAVDCQVRDGEIYIGLLFTRHPVTDPIQQTLYQLPERIPYTIAIHPRPYPAANLVLPLL